MAKKEGEAEVVDGEEGKTEEKTAAEIAAEEKAAAAEARAAEKEAEIERLKSDASSKTKSAPVGGYGMGSFSEQEWSDAEASTGLDRRAILFNLNQRVSLSKEMRDSVGVLESRLAIQQEKEAIAADDPLYPKYRKEVDRFLSDIPTEMMTTPESRKKWLGKAFEFGKRSVKISSGKREADNMDTRETGKGKEKAQDETSDIEKEIFESHGKTVEDYKKLSHPFLKDGIRIKEELTVPKFGPKA